MRTMVSCSRCQLKQTCQLRLQFEQHGMTSVQKKKGDTFTQDEFCLTIQCGLTSAQEKRDNTQDEFVIFFKTIHQSSLHVTSTHLSRQDFLHSFIASYQTKSLQKIRRILLGKCFISNMSKVPAAKCCLIDVHAQNFFSGSHWAPHAPYTPGKCFISNKESSRSEILVWLMFLQKTFLGGSRCDPHAS